MPKKSENQDVVKVERLGGLAGFGLPSSHLKSRGEISISRLSPKDRQTLDALFESHIPAQMPDEFSYRITRHIGNNEQTVEAPEGSVPEAIRDCVKDTLD